MRIEKSARSLFCCVLAAALFFVLGTGAQASTQNQTRPVVAKPETEAFLMSTEPGEWAPLVFSLLGKQPGELVQKQLEARLENGRLNGFDTVEELERDILNYAKQGGDPKAFNGRDLVGALMQDATLQNGTADGAAGALLVYQGLGESTSGQVRNTAQALTDTLASLQQQDGAFAAVSGGAADVATTAKVALALLPYMEDPVVDTTVRRALAWLSDRQLPDGTFSKEGRPNSFATAAVVLLDAISGDVPDAPTFWETEKDLLAALELFYNPDGGYAANPKGLSRVDATEQVLIARFAHLTGQFPFALESTYPWYQAPLTEEPTQTPQTTLQTYGIFLLKLVLVLCAVFVLIPLTTKIGKLAEQRKWFGSLAREAESTVSPQQKVQGADHDTQSLPDLSKQAPSSRSADSNTQVIPAVGKKKPDPGNAMETSAQQWNSKEDEDIQINMSPLMPDFGTLSEEDTNGAVGGQHWQEDVH